MHCLPNPTEQLLVKAILSLNTESGYKDFLTWQAATDFQGVLPKSVIRLLPLIWHTYKAQLITNPQKDRLGGLYKKSFYNNSRLFQQLRPIVDVLEQGHFTYAFTKGIALHTYVYQDLGSRPMNDIDILIAPGDFIPALDALQQLGYTRKYPRLSVNTYIRGEMHACTLTHETLKDIDLHYYPAPYHPQHLTNDIFLNDAQIHTFRGLLLRLVSPQKLTLFLMLNYQFINEWHWIVDFAFLAQKYPVPVADLRSITQQTGLYQATLQQLLFLSTVCDLNASEEINFYQSQPTSLTNRWLIESKSFRDSQWRLSVLTNARGLSTEQTLTMSVLYAIFRWYYRSLWRTQPNEFVGKANRFIRDILNLS
ncbi:nucleotidyltransferase family protein [Spirosoma aerolatum]|uniref:nucleotidyltransferase family protein n=1 Tax=Spirosoma aerolatum TaxID=1211326 RepID=UPI0009AD58FA|nr:nucleotidyltransferase family protein [Spirosoma aerolatum]